VRIARRGIVACLVLAMIGAGAAGIWFAVRALRPHTPECVVGPHSHVRLDEPANFVLTPDQAGYAATIAAVGKRMGMPDHAVTVALATALQESGLSNVRGGDRDSLGLFQQRPSQGWGTAQQILDPVYAASAFYRRLREQPNWTELTVTQAAQRVQHSARPRAYARWEDEARAVAKALTGETAAALTCHDLTIAAPRDPVTEVAARELGTTQLTGTHEPTRGWAIGSWLVAHAPRLGVDRVTFDGRTWTAESGTWSATGPKDHHLAFHRAPANGGT
jgi:hypothetical protein